MKELVCKEFHSTVTNKSRLITKIQTTEQLYFYCLTESAQEVQGKAFFGICMVQSHTLNTRVGHFNTCVAVRVIQRMRMIYEMSWELLLGCPGHGGDNANHLYLYLWSVCGKLLVNDSGSKVIQQRPLQSCHILVLFVQRNYSLGLREGTARTFRVTQ